ncbi:MAG: phage terminase large subunit family protein, partial [Methylobacterium mesophilicum]|nr:phage terminase large subunit family protein [Methylobacterium mesophilicum]
MRRKKTPPPAAPTLKARGDQIAAAAREWVAAFKPKERMPLSEWMAEHSRLDDGGRFYAFPFQNGIADAFTDPEVAQVSVRKSSRIGYSTIVQGFIGYSIARDPRRLLIYQPTIDDAEKYSRDDLDPVLQWPAVREVATFKPRHADNQIRAKRFKGG